MEEVEHVAELVAERKYLIASAIIIGLLVRLAKAGHFGPIAEHLPARYRPLLALALGLLSGVADAVVSGRKPLEALVMGGVAAALAMAGHDVLVEGVRKGRELGEPKGEGE